MSRKAIVIFVASALIQIAITALPDTMGDLLTYRVWARALAHEGLAAAYWPGAEPVGSTRFSAPIDYPPLFPYLLWAVGHSLDAVWPRALEQDRLLDFLIRLPLCASSLLLALLVYWETRRHAPESADLALGLVALNPAIIFDTAYWGQADAPWALLVAAALVALARGNSEWSWAAVAAAALVKPLAYPFAPLIALVTVRRFGWRRALKSAGSAGLVVGLTLLPFAWIGRLTDALSALVSQIDAMPFISVNGHNLWWLVGRATPWTQVSVRPLGLVSWQALSLILFGAFYATILARLWRSSEARALYIAAASVALGFFVLSTHMHENHLFAALPLVALIGVQSRPVKLMLLALTATLLANLGLHDPFLTRAVRPYVPGPQILLPPRLEPPTELIGHLTALGYPWIAAEMRGEVSFVGLMATLANAQANVLIFVAWLSLFCMRPSFDRAPHVGDFQKWSRHLAVFAVAFVVLSGGPFIAHALRFPREHVVLLRFRDAEVRASGPDRVGVRSLEIGGQRRAVLYVRPPSEVRYRLTLPRAAILRFGIGVPSEPGAVPAGAGVTFEVRVLDRGTERAVFARRVGPEAKHNPAEGSWEDVRVDLSAFGAREVTMVFATSGSPGDSGWPSFSDPTLVSR